MRRINYKSDIPPLLLSLKVDEKQITVPECDFIVRFYIEGYEGRHYDCSHIGGVWSNCEPSDDGTKLVCYINNQRLGIGELCAEFHYISPNKRYSDGSQKSVVIIDSTELGVELVEDNGDAVTEAAIDVTLPFIYRTAYEIARDHGYTGTAEDFYSALASVVAIADAEKKRVTAEITRNANEQERIENEENRLNAESERVNAEAQRVRNEAIRGDAESDRVKQEEDRKAKFYEITGFIATVRANEGNRESNELERQTNEDTRITEEAKRVEAEKKRAAEFEQQKLDLTGKIDRSGDEMGGDLIFTDNAGVSFRTSDGGVHSMFNDTDDVAKFTADNGDTFEFKQNETPNKNSSAVVVGANLYNALDMTLDSMGSALDGDAAYRAEAGDKIFNPDTCKIQRYNSTIGGFEDLCDPIDGKLYANKMTDYIYRWNTEAKKMVFVGGVKAYTKEEADRRFAKLDDATQRVKANDLEANNSVTAKSMWIGDEGLLLGGDGNGHLTVEQDEVITDVTLNKKLATKADDVAYGVEWYNGQPTGEIQETTVKDATKNTTVTTLMLAQSYNVLEQEVGKKANKTELDTINTSIEQKVAKTDITQSTGTSTTAVMSQKAVSDIVDELEWKVTNIADEEDITVIEENGKQKLKFADRNYEPLNDSGKGYKILRKNIQTIDGVRKNILTQNMINKPNTIYEIRYDFDLNGKEITIPENCVLKFNGGSLSNGTIKGNRTSFVSMQNDCLLCDFSGTFEAQYINASYVGLHPYNSRENLPNQQDSFERLTSLIKYSVSIVIDFESGYYGYGGGSRTHKFYSMKRGWYNKAAIEIFNFGNDACIVSSLRINGNGAKFINVYPYYVGAWNFKEENPTRNDNWKSTPQDKLPEIASCGGGFLTVNYKDPINIELYNFDIDNNISILRFGGYQYWTSGMSNIGIIGNGGYVKLKNVTSKNAVCDGFFCQNHKAGQGVEYNLDSVLIEDCTFNNNMCTGCSPCAGTNVVVRNCLLEGNGRIFYVKGYMFENPWAAMDIEPNPLADKGVKNVLIENCIFKDFNTTGICCYRQNVDNLIVNNCKFIATETRRRYREEVVDGITDYIVYNDKFFPELHSISGIKNSLIFNNICLDNVRFSVPSQDQGVPKPNTITDERQYYYDFDNLPKCIPTFNNLTIKGSLEGNIDINIIPPAFNYKRNVVNNVWERIDVSTSNKDEFSYWCGDCRINNLVIDVYSAIKFETFAGNAIYGRTIIDRLTINIHKCLLDTNKKYSIFSSSPTDGMLSSIDNLIINDMNCEPYIHDYEPYTNLFSQKNVVVYELFKNIQYYRLGKYPGIYFSDLCTEHGRQRTENFKKTENGAVEFDLFVTTNKEDFVGPFVLAPKGRNGFGVPKKGTTWFCTSSKNLQNADGTTESRSNFLMIFDGEKWTDMMNRIVT